MLARGIKLSRLVAARKLPTFPASSHVQNVRQMSLMSLYQRLLTNHTLYKKNYIVALEEIENLSNKDELVNSIEYASETPASNYTDMSTLFETLKACLIARSKLEQHWYLPILQEDIQVSELLSNEQRKTLQQFKKEHVIEHQQLNHLKKLIDSLHKHPVQHNKELKKEVVDQLKDEIAKLYTTLDYIFKKEEDVILTPVLGSQLDPETKSAVNLDIIESIELEEQKLATVEDIAVRLAEKTLDEIIKFRDTYKDRKGIAADSILKEFRKELPRHIWFRASQNYLDLSDYAL
jgi:hypothetical protein